MGPAIRRVTQIADLFRLVSREPLASVSTVLLLTCLTNGLRKLSPGGDTVNYSVLGCDTTLAALSLRQHTPASADGSFAGVAGN